MLAKCLVLLAFLEELKQPLLYRLPSEPALVRPVEGTGAVYWLLPDGTVQPAGKKQSFQPILMGMVQQEYRLLPCPICSSNHAHTSSLSSSTSSRAAAAMSASAMASRFSPTGTGGCRSNHSGANQ